MKMSKHSKDSVDCEVAVGHSKEKLMKENHRKGDKILAALRTFSGMVAHVAAVGFTLFMFYISKPGTSLFSWHPALMSFSFMCLMVEAILVFNPESSLLLKASRKTKVRVHWTLQTCAVVCGLLGFVTIVLNKIQNSKEHFKSWHGMFGLITIIYCVVQAGFGVFLLYPQVAKKWNWKLIQLKVYHATFGLLGFTLVSVTIILSLFSNFVANNVEGFLWGLCFFCPAWCILIVMNQVTNTYLPITRRSGRTAPL
ncbi:transmembrane reductase CYB561D2-like [Clavelina lepadiformis]|uniref:transmembrane reductase CYB561D2-like n=1 Tax=Clavelina lepadiformis TaxID=159417 RepID=UPI004042D2A4